MIIDLTLQITPAMTADAQGNEKRALTGHLGTHFDIMDQIFPLEYTERDGIVFDVSGIAGDQITLDDIDLSIVRPDMFVAFYSGFIARETYGSRRYFTQHPQLSLALIDSLLARGISIIGIDFAGVRRGAEHPQTDQLCADRSVFIVENLCNLQAVLAGRPHAFFRASTYPIHYAGMSGLPCRVIARV